MTVSVVFEVNTYTVTFDTNDRGTVTPASSTTNALRRLDSLPTPTGGGDHRFDGWFTAGDGGTKVTMDTVFTSAATIYAHWTYTGGGGGGGGSYTPSYTVTVPTYTKNGSVSVDTKNAKPGSTVTITLTPDAGYTDDAITVLDKNGKAVEVTPIGNGKYTFKMPSGKVEIQATFSEDNAMLNFFTDVIADSYYYDAVLWAAKNGITGGIGENHFGPGLSCTRAQFIANSGFTHGTIVVRSFAPSHHDKVQACGAKMTSTDERKEAGVERSGAGLPGQRVFRKRMVPSARGHINDLLPLGAGAVDRRSERWAGIVSACDLCGAAGTGSVTQRCRMFRHTAYRECKSGHLSRL